MPRLFRIFPHPVVLIGRAVGFFDGRLNREARSDRARRERGIATVVIVVAGAAAVGAALGWFCAVVRFGWAFEIFLVAVMVAQRSLFDHVSAVADALEQDGLAGGRAAIRHIVGRDPESLDTHGVARAGIESLAENFSDGVVAPSLFYALFGLPGLFAYKAVNTLDSMIGHKTPRHRAFGWAAARFDDLVNLAPARLSGLLVAAGALTAGGAGGRALTTMLRDAGKHRSPNAGWPEAAMAGGLGIALAGPRRYGGTLVEDAWMGDGRARVTPVDMRRALALFAAACTIHGTLYLVAWIITARPV
jgi:adenosylcobinamide-phosphate synthase